MTWQPRMAPRRFGTWRPAISRMRSAKRRLRSSVQVPSPTSIRPAASPRGLQGTSRICNRATALPCRRARGVDAGGHVEGDRGLLREQPGERLLHVHAEPRKAGRQVHQPRGVEPLVGEARRLRERQVDLHATPAVAVLPRLPAERRRHVGVRQQAQIELVRIGGGHDRPRGAESPPRPRCARRRPGRPGPGSSRRRSPCAAPRRGPRSGAPGRGRAARSPPRRSPCRRP